MSRAIREEPKRDGTETTKFLCIHKVRDEATANALASIPTLPRIVQILRAREYQTCKHKLLVIWVPK